MRIDRFLANMTQQSRTDIKKMLKAGRVQVCGVPCKDASLHIEPGQDRVEVDGHSILYQPYLYLMMNKPQGVLSATEDRYQNTVLDLLPPPLRKAGLFPAGRLDKDSEGLLLLTNHGQLAHNLLSPKKHVDKRYYIHAEGTLCARAQEIFRQGVVLEDGFVCKSAQLELEKRGPISTAWVTLREGKFHQVKRMIQAVGGEVVYLQRQSMGPLILDSRLPLGAYRPLTECEIDSLKPYF